MVVEAIPPARRALFGRVPADGSQAKCRGWALALAVRAARHDVHCLRQALPRCSLGSQAIARNYLDSSSGIQPWLLGVCCHPAMRLRTFPREAREGAVVMNAFVVESANPKPRYAWIGL